MWGSQKEEVTADAEKPIISSVIRSDVIAAAALSKCREEHRQQIGFEHRAEKAGPFHRCVEEYQRSLGGWMTAETASGAIYWFDQQMKTQWARPEPINKDIKGAVDEARGPNAWKAYQGGEPWYVCEFLSARWFGCTQRENADSARCNKELQQYAECLRNHNHPTMPKQRRR
eukprot:NODE_2649_length_760_cov_229.388186_g1858_i0.p1 GENE.NODE_2649_length_760_cov_229.388186_g1858_i0~~NODE_2649_length_760_cov_229.388186_g1858_i0.p1  ORF type:complete len:172 (-),score=23.81 NODE_2649_length_760_cov_229.388186_g1858_i0:180-695(-)